MRLLLCEPSDVSALWAWRALRARGMQLELVTSDALAASVRWEHRLRRGPPFTRIDLVDGRRLDSRELHGVVNRLVAPPRLPAAVTSGDRDYAAQEMWALWTSWLAGLPEPMLGRPAPQSLCGPYLHISEWLMLAVGAGLRTPPWRGDATGFEDGPVAARPSVTTLIVVAGAVVGRPAPAPIVVGAQALAREVGGSLLGLAFDPSWTFLGATPLPDLRRGGDPLLDVLTRVLGGR